MVAARYSGVADGRRIPAVASLRPLTLPPWFETGLAGLYRIELTLWRELV